MTFRFRLEKVLHFVRLKETVKKMELASIAGRIRFLTDRIAEMRGVLRDLLSRPHDSAFAVFQTQKIAADAREVSRLESVLRNEETALEKKRRELNRILMRKKGLESLREKRHQEFRMEKNRREQRKLDDLHQIRGNR